MKNVKIIWVVQEIPLQRANYFPDKYRVADDQLFFRWYTYKRLHRIKQYHAEVNKFLLDKTEPRWFTNKDDALQYIKEYKLWQSLK